MAITVAMRTEITQLYVALFGRAPDAEGLGFWVSLRDSGQSLTQIANTMYATAPARAYFPLFLTNQEIIASFYVNVLGRTADAEGLAFWTAKLNAAGATPGSVITQMISVVVTYAGTDPAGLTSKALFNNKVEVAQFYAEHDGDIAGATAILSTITADHATVVAAEAAILVIPPVVFNLTTGVDVVNAADGSNNVVNGIADVAGTFTTGDAITGSTTTVFNLAVNGSPPSLSTVTNVGTVNVNGVVSSSVSMDLWSGVGAVNLVTPTIAGATVTLTNAQVATTFGIVGNSGNLTATYRDTAGAADTAKISLNNAGTSTTVSTVDVSSGNTVEGLSIATAGTNFATINGGTGVKTITIAGTGADTFTFGATAATLTVDASTTTAAQKLTFVSGSIGAEDTIKGGTAADTVTANAITTFAHMTGIETLVTTVNGGVALLDGANVSGLTTMTINQGSSAGAEFFTNMKSEFATLNINGPTLTQDVNYVTDAAATLAVNYGAGSSQFDTSFDGLSVDEVKSLSVTFNVGGVAAVDMTVLGDITLDKTDTTSLTLIQAGSDDTFTTSLNVQDADALDNLVIRATGDNSSISVSLDVNADVAVQGLQTLEVTASGISSTAYVNDLFGQSWSATGTGATYSVTSTTNALSLTSYALTASGNSSLAYISTYIVNVGDMSTFSITASGNSSDAYQNYDYIEVGNLGTFTVTASGNSSEATMNSYVSVFDGDVGSINIVATGNDAQASMDYTFYVYRGDVGTVNITASGNDSTATLYNLSVYDGSVGTINITASNNDAYASLSYLYVYTGDVTAVNITASGASSSAYMYNMSVTGNVGDIAITASGDSSSAYVSYIYVYSGDLDSITLTASGDDSSAYGYTLSVSGDVGSWSLLASGDSASAYQEFDWVGGDVGTMSIVASGDSASAYLYTTLTVDGDVGSLTVTASGASADASFDGYNMYVGGNLGPVNVTASGQQAWASVNAYVSGNVPTVNLTASGAGASGSVEIYNNDGSMNLLSLGVNATGADSWAGAYIDTGTGILGNVTIQATKANSSATLYFDGNTFGTITATTGAPSAAIYLNLDNITTAGGTITSSGSGTLTIDLIEKSITSLNASGQTNAVTFNVSDVTKATAAMTITTGSFADVVYGGKGADTFAVGGGADTIHFDNVDTVLAAGGTLSAVTDTIASGFTSGSDKLDFTTAGSGTNYAENLTAAASLAALVTAADTALNGTIQYYFGVVGTDGYLVYDADGTGQTVLIKMTGVVDMAFGDII